MNIPKISASTNFNGVKLKNAKQLFYATAAATALLAATQAKAQDPTVYTFGGSANASVVKLEDYQALQLKFQQAITERQAYQNNQSNGVTPITDLYESQNRYINLDGIIEHEKKNLMTNSILEGLGLFVLGAIGGVFAKTLGKD